MWIYVWIGVAMAMGIVEAATLGLTTIWFLGGAVVAGISALCGAPVWLQILLFLVISVLLLVFTRPIVVKYFNRDIVKTNVESAVGQVVKVLVEIDNENSKGYVSYNGVEWMARSKDGSIIPEGTMVKIVEVEGVKLIVERR